MDEQQNWPARPWFLSAAGAVIGLGLYVAVERDLQTSFVRASAATFLFVFGMLLGFTLDRVRWLWSVLFALGGGAVAFGLLWWNGGPRLWEGPEGWRFLSAALALFIAAPAFQTARDSEGRALPYRPLFDHGWTNVVLWCAGWAFVGIVWLLSFLLGALFNLIGIDALADLLNDGWFAATLTGAAFGGALGILREQGAIMALLQRVVLNVLRVLAPVLGVGLLIFLTALPFTGLAPLWEATRSTTPILLACIVGALILANAVIGADADEEARPRALRWGAMALAAAVLPLALIAAVSVGLRIDQHGMTPERLWALTGVAVASAYGLAYLVALIRGGAGWAAHVRPANRSLTLGLLGMALLLATPLVGFSALSTRDQVARLESGSIAPDRFDWAALAFDFGPSGRRALQRLSSTGDVRVRALASRALAAKDRWTLSERSRAAEAKVGIAQRVRVIPRATGIPEALVEVVTRNGQCSGGAEAGTCILRYEAGARDAVLVLLPANCTACEPAVQPFTLGSDGRWEPGYRDITHATKAEDREARARLLADGARQGRIGIREVRRRQVFIGDTPVGPVFE